jgi:hypothetical protein
MCTKKQDSYSGRQVFCYHHTPADRDGSKKGIGSYNTYGVPETIILKPAPVVDPV